jgi:ribonuclease J
MNLKLHGGANTIGGNCVEVTSETDRILIDFGWPIGSPDDPDFQKKFKGKSTDELIKTGFIPDIKGLYKGTPLDFTGALLSHSHPDHYGFMSHVNPKLKIYTHRTTGKIIFAATLFGQAEPIKARILGCDPYPPFPLGQFTVEPFEADHSAAGAYSFLILDENSKKRLFYSGDIAGHLSNPYMFNTMLNRKWKIDCLLLEGTNIDRSEGLYPSEEAVKVGISKVCSQHAGYIFFACSSQNLTRLHSAYAAAQTCGRTLVIDPYTAFILKMYEDLPGNRLHYNSTGIKIFFTRSSYTAKVSWYANLMAKMRRTEITKDEISSAPGKYILKDSWDMRHSFASLATQGEKPVLIYSLWDGYLKRDQQFWNDNKIEIIKIHTSGHAYKKELLKLVTAMQPKLIIPIHTAHKEMYQDLFKDFKVEPHNPGEEFKI